MNYWVVTDTHFGHHAMRDYCGRPEGFESQILSAIRHHVRKEDVLIHIGDVCIYKDEYWHDMLDLSCDGKKWLVKGNHDRKSNSWYLNHGWDFVAESMVFRQFGLNIALSHKPLECTEGCDINVHGHHHNTGHHPEDIKDPKHKLFFIEHDYKPVKLRTIVGM